MLFGFATPLSPWRKKTCEFFSLSYLLNQGIPIILLTAVKFCVFNKGGLQREVSLNDRPKKETTMHSRLTLSTAVLVILLASTAIAQTFRGGISGNVTDSTGAAIPGAIVEIVNEGTGLTRSQPTTSNGDCTYADLPAGLYPAQVTTP